MKVILNEEQYSRLLLEDVQGIDEFMDELSLYYRRLKPEHLAKIKFDIGSSGCEKVEFSPFSKEFTVGNNSPSGLSLPHGVMLNVKTLDYPLPIMIYILFHEIGHQYQYKKYGEEFAFKLYRNDADIDESIQQLKQIETTADQFGIRKCREYLKLGIIDRDLMSGQKGAYDNIKREVFEEYINKFKNKIVEMGVNTPDEIGTMMYNWIKLI